MSALTTILLAQEEILHKTWWNPYVKGILIVAFAIALFCGSAFLLLYTNVGSRLGLLLTLAALTGWLTLQSLAWITQQFPNGPLGKTATWPVKERIEDLSRSKYPAVRTIQRTGRPASEADVGQIKPDFDAALAGPKATFRMFDKPTDYLIAEAYTVGGGRKWPFWWTQKTEYAAAQICPVPNVKVPFGQAPPPPQCDPSKPKVWVVSIHNLGNRRQPSFLVFGGSALLFALTLMALSRYERERAALEAGPAGDGQGDGGEPAGGDGAPSGEPAPEPEPAGV